MHWLPGVLLCAGLVAQGRTWVVDANGGAGTDFTTLPPAIAAAADGDTIRVRAGSYSGATTGKALTILGDNGAMLSPLFPSLPMVVDGLPAGRDFAFVGFSIRQVACEVRNCAGRVLFDRVTFFQPASFSSPGALRVTDAAQVMLNACSSLGSPGVMCIRSQVSIVDCDLTGQDNYGPNGLGVTQPGLQAEASRVEIARSQLTGGTVRAFFPGAVPAPGASLVASSLVLRGDATSVIATGTGAPTDQVPAVLGSGNSATVDPTVTLRPHGGAPGIQGFAVVVQQCMPALVARGVTIGVQVRTDLYSSAGDQVVLIAGLRGDELPFPPLAGSFFFDLTVPRIALSLGVQGTNEHLAFAYQQPVIAELSGKTYTLQCVSGTLATGFQLSNPASFAVH